MCNHCCPSSSSSTTSSFPCEVEVAPLKALQPGKLQTKAFSTDCGPH